jgi:hypothetical protein
MSDLAELLPDVATRSPRSTTEPADEPLARRSSWPRGWASRSCRRASPGSARPRCQGAGGVLIPR